MHSRIFQVARCPIAEEDRAAVVDYEDSRVIGAIADYVVASNRELDLDWLQQQLQVGA